MIADLPLILTFSRCLPTRKQWFLQRRVVSSVLSIVGLDPPVSKLHLTQCYFLCDAPLLKTVHIQCQQHYKSDSSRMWHGDVYLLPSIKSTLNTHVEASFTLLLLLSPGSPRAYLILFAHYWTDNFIEIAITDFVSSKLLARLICFATSILYVNFSWQCRLSVARFSQMFMRVLNTTPVVKFPCGFLFLLILPGGQALLWLHSYFAVFPSAEGRPPLNSHTGHSETTTTSLWGFPTERCIVIFKENVIKTASCCL